jgi:hypothetical protein
LLGELLVLKMEKARLEAAGRATLAAQVRHVSVLENDTAGYDILSFENDGSKRFIEVKTTRGSVDADFFISANELIFASLHSPNYYLYRLYDYIDITDSAKYFVLKGDLSESGSLQLIPTHYKVSICGRDGSLANRPGEQTEPKARVNESAEVDPRYGHQR